MTTKSSPLPWKVADEIFVDDAKGVTVCLPSVERAANAALIVKAVNSHEALVEALEAAKDRMIQEGCDCGVDEPETCALCVVTAALSLAKDSK
jgi:hypothetical protein